MREMYLSYENQKGEIKEEAVLVAEMRPALWVHGSMMLIRSDRPFESFEAKKDPDDCSVSGQAQVVVDIDLFFKALEQAFPDVHRVQDCLILKYR